MKLHDLWRRCFGVVGGVSVPTQNLRCSLMKHVFCTGYSYDDYISCMFLKPEFANIMQYIHLHHAFYVNIIYIF